ncbi:MAG: YceI family protein [Rhodocyclaceae bacterium]|nr:YceI family protein [Rhodocyclaceae bacterium]
MRTRSSALLSLLLAFAASPALAERYAIDGRHSRPVFSVSHLGFSTQFGRFDDVRGHIELDPAGGKGSVDITIEAASIDMGADDWDEHMKGPDFFNVAEFPTIIYRSDSVLFEDGVPKRIDGRLAMLGQIRPVSVQVERYHCGLEVSTKRQKCGADVSLTVKRSEFGMQKYIPFVPDEVRISMPIEAYPESR